MGKRAEPIEHPHFTRFCREHMRFPEGLDPAILRRFTKLYAGQIYLNELKPDALREYGKRPYAAFSRALRVGMLELGELAERKSPALQSLHQSSDIGPRGHVKLLYHHLPGRRKLLEKLRDMRLNIGHLDTWTKLPFLPFGDFSVKPRLFVHPESPMCLTIAVPRDSYKSKNFIATLGFQLLHNGTGKTVLSINNLQGVKGEKTRLDAFSKQVGEPWQTYLAKRAVEYARVNGFSVEGQLPWPFHKDPQYLQGRPVDSRAERDYARQVGHYEQTFHNLGMKKLNGVWILHAN